MRSIVFLFVILLFTTSCSANSSPTDLHIDVTLTFVSQNLDSSNPTSTQTSTNTPKPFATQIYKPTTTFPVIPSITSTQNFSFQDIANCIPKNTSTEKGIVTRVVDGDTIYMEVDGGDAQSVRYIGIDAPENGRPLYTESLNANSSLVAIKEVYLIKDVSDIDQYDRLLRYVVVGNTFVNYELVRMGLAVAEDYPPDSACANTFLMAENEAKTNQSGMWVATQTPRPSSPQIIILTVNKKEEWVDIQNTGYIDVDLAGWNLVSERGNQDCPLSGIIRSGEILRIWAMAAEGPGFSCGYKTNIWNNSEPDPAVLYNPQGEEVSRK
jgi:endonuclease YncB( thermonuclease family)